MAWDLDSAAHLLRRAGFGGSMAQVQQLLSYGQEGAISYLLNYENISDPAAQDVNALGLDVSTRTDAAAWMLYRLLASTRPLQEKLTWFWHGHFTSSVNDVPPPLMVIQNETWRANANGNFLPFLKAMYKDPAMLDYLDNNSNVASKPNENFARESMELFTIGIGNYTETDVKQAARALTGWIITAGPPPVGTYVASRHDNGSKTVLGVTGNLNGDAIMDILFAHPATAPRICTKLYQFFVRPDVNAADLAALVATWTATNGNIKAVMNTLLHLETFWAPDTRNTLVKSPMEYTLGLAQRFQLTALSAANLRTGVTFLNNMGQFPFGPPDVAGYPQGLEWAGTSPMLARYNAANSILYGAAGATIVNQLTQGQDVSTAAKLVDVLAFQMGPLTLTGATRQGLINYVGTGGYTGTAAQVLSKTRGATHLLVSTPEYQVQ
jgi:uncharacterized protein (DUF1800 family)